MHILHLASSSASRKFLLEEARIPFIIIPQHADESHFDISLALDKLVLEIALSKMEHAQLPAAMNDSLYVLTADTLSQDSNGAIQGKPIDRADAYAKIKAARQGTRLCTAFCLDRKVWSNGWQVADRIVQAVWSEYIFDIPDSWIEFYLDNSVALRASNAIAVEGLGMQFLKTVSGSYSAIVGLPVYEVRVALKQLNFFNIEPLP